MRFKHFLAPYYSRSFANHFLSGFKAGNQGLIEEPLMGAVFESVARCKPGMCVGDRAANVHLASVNGCIFHINYVATVFKTAKHGVVWERFRRINAKRSYSD